MKVGVWATMAGELAIVFLIKSNDRRSRFHAWLRLKWLQGSYGGSRKIPYLSYEWRPVRGGILFGHAGASGRLYG